MVNQTGTYSFWPVLGCDVVHIFGDNHKKAHIRP